MDYKATDAQLRIPPDAKGVPWDIWRRRNPPTFDRAELAAWREWVELGCPNGDWDDQWWAEVWTKKSEAERAAFIESEKERKKGKDKKGRKKR